MSQYGLDPTVNFGLAPLASGISAGDTTLTLTTGYGALLPDPATLGAYNVPIWDDFYANPTNDPDKEIIRVTAKSGDVLTITRAQEGTSAVAHNTGGKTYKIGVSMTAKMVTDIETLGYSSMAKNAIMNPEAFLWQRFTAATGTTNPGVDTSTADRWKTIYDAGGGTLPTTIIHRRAELTAGEGYGLQHAYELNYNGAGSGFGASSYYCTYQKIENGTRKLCGDGKYVTVSFWAKSSVGSKKIGILIDQLYGTGGSPSSTEILTGTIFTLTSTLTRYSFTFATNTLVGKTFGTNNDDSLQILFTHQWGATFATYMGGSTAESFVGSGYTMITGVMVNVGQFPFKYSPTPLNEEIARCQRYYCKSYDIGTVPATATTVGSILSGMNPTAAGVAGVQIQFPQAMRIVPTIAYYLVSTGASGWKHEQNAGASTTFTPSSYLGSTGGYVYKSGCMPNQLETFYGHYTADAEF